MIILDHFIATLKLSNRGSGDESTRGLSLRPRKQRGQRHHCVTTHQQQGRSYLKPGCWCRCRGQNRLNFSLVLVLQYQDLDSSKTLVQCKLANNHREQPLPRQVLPSLVLPLVLYHSTARPCCSSGPQYPTCWTQIGPQVSLWGEERKKKRQILPYLILHPASMEY